MGNKSQMLKYYGLRCMPAFQEVESFLKLYLSLTWKLLASQWQILPKNVNKQYFQRCYSFLSLGLFESFAIALLHKYM